MDACRRAELAARIGEALLQVAEVIATVLEASRPVDGGPELLTTAEAAELARRSRETIRSWAKEGRLPEVGGAGRPLYRREDVQEAIARPPRRVAREPSPTARAEEILRGAGAR